MSIARFTRILERFRGDDRGVALPTVIIFMFAGVLLSMVVASTVMYSYTFSSSTRASVQSQAAAEAGIAAARAALLNGECDSTNGLYTNADPYYRVQVFKPDGTGGWVAGCPAISEEARIVSMGEAASGGVNGDSVGDVSNVEAILGSLTSDITLAASGPAIFAYSASGAGAGGRLVSLDGSNVDVMLSTGTVTCDGGFQGAANVVVKSGVFNAVGGCNLNGNVWVNGTVNIDGGAKIGGSVTGGAVTIKNGTVNGNVWADGVFTGTNGTIGGWVSGASIGMANATVGDAWARAGDVAMTGGRIKGVLTVNGSASITGGTLDKGVVASGGVSVSVSVPQGVRSGGDVTVGGGTVTGVTALGILRLTGGTTNGTVHAGGLMMIGPGWATLAGGQIDGAGCFTETGAISPAVTVESVTVGTPNNCKNNTGTGWWAGKVNVDAVATPASPVLAPSPGKPAAIIVPNWIDYGSKPTHFLSDGWPGHTVVALGTTCTPFHIYNALTTIGTNPGVIDARACTDGIVLSGSGTEYTGPFAWGDDLTRNGFTLKNDLVIIADKFSLSGSGRFTGADPETQLWLVNPDTVANGAPDCAPGQYLSITGGFQFQKLRTLVYSPCKIVIGSSTKLKGQIFAGQTEIAGGATITYAPVGLPGYDLSTGEETSVAYSEWDRPIVSQRNITG